jgi:hypothetical protein
MHKTAVTESSMRVCGFCCTDLRRFRCQSEVEGIVGLTSFANSCAGGRSLTMTAFKEFIRIPGMKHVRTSLLYRQSNGKTELRYAAVGRRANRVVDMRSE